MRHHFARTDLHDFEDAEFDLNKPIWFHNLQITLFVRDGNNITDERMEELTERTKDYIPGYDFDSYHIPIMHHRDHCIEGDIFTHEKAKKYTEIHTI